MVEWLILFTSFRKSIRWAHPNTDQWLRPWNFLTSFFKQDVYNGREQWYYRRRRRYFRIYSINYNSYSALVRRMGAAMDYLKFDINYRSFYCPYRSWTLKNRLFGIEGILTFGFIGLRKLSWGNSKLFFETLVEIRKTTEANAISNLWYIVTVPWQKIGGTF